MHDDLNKALDVLRSGGCILFPTDIGWSIGCDPTNETAVSKLNSLIETEDLPVILVDNTVKLAAYVSDIPEVAYDMMELSSNPLTVVFGQLKNLPSGVMAKGECGFRVTEETFSKTLCARFKKGILSITLTRADKRTSFAFAELPDHIIKGVDLVVNHRQNEGPIKDNSSIIKIGQNCEIKIIRE